MTERTTAEILDAAEAVAKRISPDFAIFPSHPTPEFEDAVVMAGRAYPSLLAVLRAVLRGREPHEFEPAPDMTHCGICFQIDDGFERMAYEHDAIHSAAVRDAVVVLKGVTR